MSASIVPNAVIVNEVEKHETDHVAFGPIPSHASGVITKPSTNGPPQSPFKDLKRSKAIVLFWRTALFCFMAAWGAIMDGFLITSESVDALWSTR